MSLDTYPHKPGWKGTDTSRAAAKAMEKKDPGLQVLALRELEAVWPNGLTADEIAARLDRDILAIRPRISQLKTKKLIEDTGQRRKSELGNNQAVMKYIRPKPVQMNLLEAAQ